MIPIGNINFGELEIPGNIPDIPGFGASIPGGPGAEQLPPGLGKISGIDMGIAGIRPATPKPQLTDGGYGDTDLSKFRAVENPYSNKGLEGPYAGVLEDFKNSDYFRGINSWTGMFGSGGAKEFNPFGAERGLFGDGDQEAGFLQFLDETMADGFGGNVGGDLRRSQYQNAYNAFNPFEGEGRKFDNIYEQREGQSRYSQVLTPEQKAEVARFEAMSPDERRASLTTATMGAAGAPDVLNVGGGSPLYQQGIDPKKMQNQISVANIDDQGNITGQTGVSRVVAQYGNINDFDSFSPELQAAINGYQSRPEGGSSAFTESINGALLGPDGNPMQPTGFDSTPVGGPKIDFSAPIGSPANPFGDPTETAPPGSLGPDTGFGPSNMQPMYETNFKQAGVPEYFTNAMPDFGEPPTQQPTGGMNSDFANQLLSGIGNLFDKYLSSPSMKQNNLGMGSTNQITPPTPPEQMMTADTQSSMPNSLGSQGMFTPGRGY